MTNLGLGIIGDEDARDVTIIRTAVGSFVDGIYVAGTTSTIVQQMVIVPVDGEQRLRLPEGSRSKESIRVFSPTLLHTTRDDARQVADKLVDVTGRRWLVSAVDDWITDGGFCDCMAVALARTPDTGFIYFGVGETFDVNDLTATEASEHLASFAASPIDQRIYYAYPSSFGPRDFEVNGFVGGTTLTNMTISGVPYDIIASENLVSGDFTVGVVLRAN